MEVETMAKSAPAQDLTIGTTPEGHLPPPREQQTTFLSLPPEIRNRIYALIPHQAWLSVNCDPAKLKQPALAAVNREVRAECLAVFYSQNKFVLDLRGWNDACYPKLWTPARIFAAWILAIGDVNAGRLRSLTVFAANFRVVVVIEGDGERVPVRMGLKLRLNKAQPNIADSTSPPYPFEVAGQRVESAMRVAIAEIERRAKEEKRRFTAIDIHDLNRTVGKLQPFMCTRMGLGFMGAVLDRDGMGEDEWPNTDAHLNKCNDCGYLHYKKL